MMSDSKQRMRVELQNSDLDKLSLGTMVRVTTEGTIVELRAPEKYTMPAPTGADKSEERTEPPCMYVQVDSTKVMPVGNKQIEDIVADDEAEEAAE